MLEKVFNDALAEFRLSKILMLFVFYLFSTGNTDEALRDHPGRSGSCRLAVAGRRMLGEAMVWRQRSLTRRDYLILPIGCWAEPKEGRARTFAVRARADG